MKIYSVFILSKNYLRTQQSIIGDGEMTIEVCALDRFFHMVPQTKYETLPFARPHIREQTLFPIDFDAIYYKLS